MPESGARTPFVVAIMPARNSAKTLAATVRGIPPGCVDAIVLVDNKSHDETASIAEGLGLKVIRHPADRGYGGSLKSCLSGALALGADLIVELHPDNQYSAEAIPELLRTAEKDDCALVIGSRFLPPRKALDGGMPLWKYLSNRILSRLNGWLLGLSLSEFHSGLRVFDARFIRAVPYDRLSNDFAFGFELLTEALSRGLRVSEVPASSRYFPEASSNGFWGSLRYGLATLRSSLSYRLRLRSQGQ